MLSSLANYLLGGSFSAAHDSGKETNNDVSVVTRLSQVEVEGEDWILIDRAVEGATNLEESWYVMPPACFTTAGPVNIETSPLENLLIEHPSMSVYRATASPVNPDTPPPTPNAPDDSENDVLPSLVSGPTPAASPVPSSRGTADNQENIRPSHRNDRPPNSRARPDVMIVRLRSAQKILENRTTQLLKRGRLERSNKLCETFSVKGKRPRRQDRLRTQNSGANNNRKC